ncbi:MAG TPA: GNAT family N-acetyltransferase [Candidatus Hydrogenedentes bacterium]|nr:GNAT family N-acetyltransferase [Candidatus Hydrogenedentota bacterium]
MPLTDCEEMVVELRKIIHLLDLHSRWLNREYALTSPQLVFLKEIGGQEGITIGDLAKRTSLSCATATGIVDRLERRGLVARSRNGRDRRQVQLHLTPTGRETCERRPPILQETFVQGLERLEPAERRRLLDSLRRLTAMMSGLVEDRMPSPAAVAEILANAPEAACAAQDSPAEFLESCRMLLAGASNADSPDAAPGNGGPDGVGIHVARSRTALEARVAVPALARFLHEHLKPYEDPEDAVLEGIEYALSEEPGKGGFVLLAELDGELAGALVMLNTGMRRYVPPNLLLFIAVDAAHRGRGIGARLVRKAQSLVEGDIKLHVEYENPARRLYERLGFSSKYAEMRWAHEPRNG